MSAQLEQYVQASAELEFEDSEDPITLAGASVAWVAKKLLGVTRCFPVGTCQPKEAWTAAREGRACGSLDTKWGRKLESLGLKLSFASEATEFSSDLQRAYQVGADFGGWRKKQEAWEASAPEEENRSLHDMVTRYIEEFGLSPADIFEIAVQARAIGEDQKLFLEARRVNAAAGRQDMPGTEGEQVAHSSPEAGPRAPLPSR